MIFQHYPPVPGQFYYQQPRHGCPILLRGLRNKAIRDFLIGLVLFGSLAASGIVERAPIGTSWIASAAHARLLESEAFDPGLVPFLVAAPSIEVAAGSQQQIFALLCLALAFSTIFAFNLWFARHLLQAHATNRPHGRRRR